jgi:type II secretory pathway pseudopilin PulG
MTDAIVTTAILALLAVVAAPSALESIRTHERNGAARSLLSDIRSTQHLAVTRRGTYGLQWGADPNASLSKSEFRVVRDMTGSCSIPATGAAEDGVNVVQGWQDLSEEFPGVTIESVRDNGGNLLGGVMFDSRGASVNTCTAVSFPVRVTVADSEGRTKVIEIQRAGGTHLP